MLSLALTSLALAGGPAEALLDELPQTGMIVRCSSARDFTETWGGDSLLDELRERGDSAEAAAMLQEMMNAGLDVDEPLTMAAVNGGRNMLVTFEVEGDPQVMVDTLSKELEDEDVTVRANGSQVVLTGPLDFDTSERPLGDGEGVTESLSLGAGASLSKISDSRSSSASGALWDGASTARIASWIAGVSSMMSTRGVMRPPRRAGGAGSGRTRCPCRGRRCGTPASHRAGRRRSRSCAGRIRAPRDAW